MWDLIPINLKEIGDSEQFEQVTKRSKPENCPYRLCKVYLQMSVFHKTKLKTTVVLMTKANTL